MTHADQLTELIELGDSNEMLREVDRRCLQADWEGLLELSERCRRASVERGKPLWGAAVYGEYRLALEGPADYLVDVIDADTGPFALGPLPEVAASTHAWSDVEDVENLTPAWGSFIYERVVRGEAPALETDAASSLLANYELPLSLMTWEPSYVVATYHDDHGKFPRPVLVKQNEAFAVDVRSDAEEIDDDTATEALKDLARAWRDQSNGSLAVSASSDLAAAVSAVDPTANTLQEVSAESAMNTMAWTAASGGVHGRRSGMAVGRAKLWWALAALSGTTDHWPIAGEDFGALIEALAFYTWDTDRTGEGFSIALAVVDREENMAFAVYGFDEEVEVVSPV